MNPKAEEAYHWIGMFEYLQSKCKEFEEKLEELANQL